MKEDIKLATIVTNEPQDFPFVNEECGDTMWDPVLKELEDKLANAIGKPAGLFTEKGDEKTE